MKKSVLFMGVLLPLAIQAAGLESYQLDLSFQPDAQILLDGSLAEPAWQQAQVLSLQQQEPKPGEATDYPTQVRMLSDGSNLYIGITATDPDPTRLSVHSLQRDAEMSGDDTFAVVLDTFGDHRTAYVFRINAAGARQDGLIDATGALSLDWNGIWDAAVTRLDEGWSAEIVIPSRTLSFNPDQGHWGLNVERSVPRELLTLRWSGISLDSRLTDLRRAGTLGGTNVMEQGRGLSITPYVLGNANFQEGKTSSDTETGFDLTYNITPELSGVLTYNTDFAETEVDDRQVNLSRFNILIPEKRSFFLQGSNQFAFGEQLNHSGQLNSAFIPFFSRRIGLVGGSEVPIVTGLKLVGKAGKLGVGILGVLTDDTLQVPGTELFAGRFTYDANDNLQLGMMATQGDPAGLRDNTLVGADATWRTSELFGDKNFVANIWATRSSGDIPEGKPTGWGLGFFYPNDLWDLQARIFEYGDALDPALGFLPRPGTRQYRFETNWRPRPEVEWLDWIRQYVLELKYSRVDDLHGNNESYLMWVAPVFFQSESGEEVEINYMPQGETLKQPFEVADGVIIPPGEYDYIRYRLALETSKSRPWDARMRLWFGDFFGGTLTTLDSALGLTFLDSRLNLSFETQNNRGELPQGKFDIDLYKFRVGYNLNPDLRISSFIQYDSKSGQVGSNTRLHWIITPGRELFFVWNRGAANALEMTSAEPRTVTSNNLSIKLNWTFRP